MTLLLHKWRQGESDDTDDGWGRKHAGRGASSYARQVLPLLRDDRGKPSVTVRVLAGAVVLGMLLIAAPALVPVLRWASDLLF